MDFRYLAAFSVFALGAFDTQGVIEETPSDGMNSHPGKVLDAETQRPINASVKAWPESAQTGETGQCVMYGNAPLNATTSDESSGLFELKIDSEHKTYTVVYCANNYATRVDRDLPNNPDGSPVLPTPANLFPIDYNYYQTEAYEDRVLRTAVFALNELAYLRGFNGEQFGAALDNYAEDLSPEASQALQGLGPLVELWRDQSAD